MAEAAIRAADRGAEKTGEKGAAAKQLRKQAGRWLKVMREQAGLTQADLADRLGLRYYTFISQVEGGHGRVPSEQFEAWAVALGIDPRHFTQVMLKHYDPPVYWLLFPAGHGSAAADGTAGGTGSGAA